MRITTLLPNPAGDEQENEAITTRNGGASPVSLDDWRVCDEAERMQTLSGTFAPGDEVTVKRAGQPMALNNGGDTVALLNPDSEVVQSVHDDSALEGAVTPVTP